LGIGYSVLNESQNEERLEGGVGEGKSKGRKLAAFGIPQDWLV